MYCNTFPCNFLMNECALQHSILRVRLVYGNEGMDFIPNKLFGWWVLLRYGYETHKTRHISYPPSMLPTILLSLSVPLSPSLVMESSSNFPKHRGRPVDGSGSAGSRRKTKEGSGIVIKEEGGANPSVAMELKVLEVASGSDVIAAVYDFAKRYQVDVGIISAYGMVSNITIYQPQPFPNFPIHQFDRLYHLVSIKGSFYGSVNSIRPPPSFDSHFVSFTGCDGQYHAGIILGGITAVNTVVLGVSLIRGTTCSIKLPLPPPPRPLPSFPAQNEDVPTEPFCLDEIFSGTGRSMPDVGVPSVASPANLNVWKSLGSGSSASFFK
ncbi:AT-hook motif nuclear-localized protein 17 [Artemisia annua]|uniref:AT-hook motif nuclear-localized protein 17 n=1 Tax=Artemisia annua TaxID=35608 RepID=A0A2U1MT37_ARTAN|nr:AT-hook motif nuclear-localized protein 17 [Artemisia annua]